MAKVPFENGDFGENGRNGEQLLIPNGMTKGPFGSGDFDETGSNGE